MHGTILRNAWDNCVVVCRLFSFFSASKKQTVVGNTYFKVFFLSLPILNLISNSLCAKPHVLEKPYG